MGPSQLEKQIEDKLELMLSSQQSAKGSLRTNSTEDRLISSFVASANQTLNKYCHENSPAEHPCRRKQLL